MRKHNPSGSRSFWDNVPNGQAAKAHGIFMLFLGAAMMAVCCLAKDKHKENGSDIIHHEATAQNAPAAADSLQVKAAEYRLDQ